MDMNARDSPINIKDYINCTLNKEQEVLGK